MSPASPLGVHRPTGALGERGIYLGIGERGWAWTGAERSTLVLGPSRSGKTSSLVIPNVLAAAGAVVSTSTKPDVLRLTAPTRRRVRLDDVVRPERVHRRAARRTQGGMVATRRRRATGTAPSRWPTRWCDHASGATAESRAPSDDHWSERAASLLAPILHAAALGNAEIRDVLSWVDRHDGASALRMLGDGAGDGVASDVLAGILATDEREQSGIWSTASGVLTAYRSRAALASTNPPYLDPASLLRGPQHPVRLCHGPPAAAAGAARGRDPGRDPGRRLLAGRSEVTVRARALRAGRGRQHRPAPRPARDRERGRGPGPADARLSPGSVPGPFSAGERRPRDSSRSSARPSSSRGSPT